MNSNLFSKHFSKNGFFTYKASPPIIIGVLGTILPIIVSIYGYSYLYDKTGGKLFSQFIQLVKPFPFSLYVSLILLVIGVLVGMYGSNKAVRKYLKI